MASGWPGTPPSGLGLTARITLAANPEVLGAFRFLQLGHFLPAKDCRGTEEPCGISGVSYPLQISRVRLILSPPVGSNPRPSVVAALCLTTRSQELEATISRSHFSEGGMIRLETPIELNFINSNCSSSSSYWKYTTNMYRAVRADSISANGTRPPSF